MFKSTPRCSLLCMTLALMVCGDDAPRGDLDAGRPDRGPPRACVTLLDCPKDHLCRKKVCAAAASERHDLGGGAHALLVFDAGAGTFDLFAPNKQTLLRGAYAHADLGGFKTALSSTKMGAPVVKASSGTDEPGSYQAVTAAWTTGGLTLTWRAAFYKKSGAFVFRAGVKNGTAAAVVVDKLAPVRARGSAGGGLFLGKHPKTHRILENGAGGMTDQYAALVMADKEKDAVTQMAPGKLEGSSASNWSHLIWDSASGKHCIVKATLDAKMKPGKRPASCACSSPRPRRAS